MTYNEEMEMALLNMTSHPEFIGKNLVDEMDANEPVSVVRQISHRRLSGWYRKRMYRKKLIRRFLSCNPALNIAEMSGTSAYCGIYFCLFENSPYNPRHIYNINLYEKLFLSHAGDIRVCKKRIVHHGGCRLFGIFPSEIPDAKHYTNRRIRSKPIRMDDSIPSSPAYYKKKYSRLIDDSI